MEVDNDSDRDSAGGLSIEDNGHSMDSDTVRTPGPPVPDPAYAMQLFHRFESSMEGHPAASDLKEASVEFLVRGGYRCLRVRGILARSIIKFFADNIGEKREIGERLLDFTDRIFEQLLPGRLGRWVARLYSFQQPQLRIFCDGVAEEIQDEVEAHEAGFVVPFENLSLEEGSSAEDSMSVMRP